MPRAKRYHIPGYVWHITHRCHKREFLLKFVRDRRRCMQWLFEAKKRYGLIILNYMVTSNHVHLLLYDSGDSNAIARSIQLIAGRTAQEFNKRKLGHRARGRGVKESDIGFELREPILGYNGDYSAENAILNLHNRYSWNVNCEYSEI